MSLSLRMDMKLAKKSGSKVATKGGKTLNIFAQSMSPIITLIDEKSECLNVEHKCAISNSFQHTTNQLMEKVIN